MTPPMKILLHRNFFSNTFTCEEDHEKGLRSSEQLSRSILVRAVGNKTERGRQQGCNRLLNTLTTPYCTAVAVRTFVHVHTLKYFAVLKFHAMLKNIKFCS